MKRTPLFTDLYELTMMQGYFFERMNKPVVFDMFFRRPPFGGGFAIFAGLDDLLDELESLRFSEDDIDYLRDIGLFKTEFLDFLGNLRFTGDLYAVDEGTPVFPNQPLVRVHAGLIEAQLIEGMLLNIVNYQTLVATKAARVFTASREGKILEFGLRRAQGHDGAISAARAAFIGGAGATSNTLAGKTFGIPVSGTMAHSWVMAFEDELTSFQKYAELYPDSAILLIDTYDTIGSGLENAVRVGKQLKQQGKSFGVRLDSGDLDYLSRTVRRRLDQEGLTDAKIAVSNELNEEIIHQLVTGGAPIDLWGVGTHLVTGGSDASLTGVYKLAARQKGGEMIATIKVSNNPEKITNPGIKQVYRFFDDHGMCIADYIALIDEDVGPGREYIFHHPDVEKVHFRLSGYDRIQPLLTKRIEGGRVVSQRPSLPEIQEHTRNNLHTLDYTYKRIINPHRYKVSLSRKLKDLKFSMVNGLSIVE